MNKKVTKRLLSFILSFVMILGCVPATAFAVAAAEAIDVALYATPTTDYVSSWENLNGINNEDFNPSSSKVGAGYGWGNWSQSEGSVHWLQYDWDTAITTDTMQVYWYHDGGGTQIPSAIQFQYKDSNGAWQDLAMVSTLDDVLGLNKYNTIQVESVTTTAIRFNQTVREGAAANGVYRWKVMASLTDDIANMALDYAKENLVVSSRMSTDTKLASSLTNGVTVTWKEDHAALAIENGTAVVTRGASDVAGKLTATLSLNGKTVEKTFDVTVPAAMDAIPDMLAKYDFSELNGSQGAGTVISDASGHDNNATIYGSGVTASNDALVLPGGNAYVELPTGMFDGQDNLTISMWIQNDNGANWTSAFFFGKNTTSYFMINPQNPTSQTAKVCATWSGSQSEIGLSPGQNISAGPSIGSEWTHYTVVFTPQNLSVYLNGEKYGTYETNRTISAMGTNLVSYIGKSAYSDPYFKGKVKNINIYSKAVSDAEAGAIYTEGLTDQQILDNVAASLTIPEVKNGILSTRLNDTITLSETALSGLVSISWSSDNVNILPVTGEVNAPEEDTTVKMSASLALNGIMKEVEFDIVVLAEDSTSYEITLNANDTGAEISQELFGLFYEDINSAADGGLATELVKNNSFENYADIATPSDNAGRGDQTSWKMSWTSSNSSNFVVEQTNGLHANNTNYAKLTGSQTLSNNGFAARNNLRANAISIENGVKYDFSMWMKAESSYNGKVTVQVVNSAGTAITDVQTLELKKDGTWQKVETVLTGNAKALGKLVLTFSEAAVSDVIYIDMVSLNSQNVYGYGNKNYAYGAGLRKDLVETIAALNPSFIRFPGGCVIEGDMGTHGFYDWENSVGPLEERKATANYWSKHELNNYVTDYGYMMSYEFGYHEILTLCEELGAEPFPILSAGIFCQFRNSADPIQVGDPRLDEFADKGVHLLDYCWGDPNSADEQEAYWAGLRVQNGHAEPFDLKYMGIGNENWNEGKVNYYANFKYMREYIESYAKEHYPDRELTIISSTGPYATGAAMDNAWRWIDSEMPGETLVDEHYYVSLQWMLQNTHRYDYYDRLDEGGSNVFVGEYAVNSSINTLEAAIAEAAYMTGFERNGDIVRHASVAPLLCRLGSDNWSPNFIYFDEDEVMRSANYYTQWMYANNYGGTLLNTDLSLMNKSGNYVALSNLQTDIYQVSSMDKDFIYLKLVNHDDYVKDITLNYPGIDSADAEIICMTGAADAVNSLGNEVVAPVSTKAAVVDGKLLYNVPAMSFTVVKVAIGDKDIEIVVDKTKLENAINNAVSADEKDTYTEETWAAYEAALNAAKAVLAKEDATQAEVNNAASALTSAQAALKVVQVVKDGNIALYAATSASYNTNWNKGDTAVNDGDNQVPDSDDYATTANNYTWGTWGNTSDSEWITLTWEAPMVIESSDLYIWTDNGGIHVPTSYVYEYLPEGSEEWVELKSVNSGITASLTGALNSVTFDEPVVATALRCTLTKDAADNNGIGLVEWEVYGKAAGEDETLLADFNFDAAPAEGAAFDGGNAQAAGIYTLEDHGIGKALKLDGNGQFLNLTAKDGSSLLTGLDELTVSFQMNPETSATNWGFFASPSDATQEYRSEKYIGIFDNNGAIGAERYNSNAMDRPAQPSTSAGYGNWYHVAVVYTAEETILYLNGEEAAREASVVDISDMLGENSVAYIGKATWVGGEYYKGLIDNYKIYGRVLTADEIAKEAAKYVDKTDLLAAIAEAEALLGDGEDKYTPSTWEALKDALAAAKEVAADNDATQTEVNEATTALRNAIDKLTGKADMSALQALVDQAKAMDSTKYTEDTWADVEKELADAEKVLANPDARQAAVDSAVKQLQNAIDDLAGIDDPTPTPTPTPDDPFRYDDVAEGDWFWDAVYYCYDEGLMTGMTETSFGPYGQLSRAQFALILYRMAGEPEVETDKTFADITGDEWYGQAVLWAAEAEVVNGYLDGNFGPADNITREQMALMMFRYANYLEKDTTNEGDLGKFSDGETVSPFATDALKWAADKGIITGKGSEEPKAINPQGETARCEAAAIIQRFMNAYAE